MTARETEHAYLERRRAWSMVRAALKSGELVRPAICMKCGRESEHLHAHHDSYGRPLAVRWLCLDCHRALHARIRQGIKLEPLTKAAAHE